MKDFTLYPEALELKQLGFDEPCIARYNVPGDLITTGCYTDSHITHLIVEQSDICEAHVLAPTYSQAFRWFREKYNLKSCIIFRTSMEDNKEYYDWLIKGQEVVYRHFTTYEQAELACLQQLIKIVKEQQK